MEKQFQATTAFTFAICSMYQFRQAQYDRQLHWLQWQYHNFEKQDPILKYRLLHIPVQQNQLSDLSKQIATRSARCNHLSSSIDFEYKRHRLLYSQLYSLHFLQICAVNLVVVVLPFVPVIAMIGILPCAAFWKQHFNNRFCYISRQSLPMVQHACENPEQHLLPASAPPFSVYGSFKIGCHNINTANIQSDDSCNSFSHKNIYGMHFICYICGSTAG